MRLLIMQAITYVAVMLAGSCAAPPKLPDGPGQPNAPQLNGIQTKLWALVPTGVSGELTCKPIGRFKSLLEEPNRCRQDLDDCGLATELATGGGREFVDLFADLLRLGDPRQQNGYYEKYSTPPYQSRCPFSADAQDSFPDNLALQGLGYAGAKQYGSVLAAIVEAGYYSRYDRERASLLVEALWRTGNRARGSAALARILQEARSEPPTTLALQYLTRWRAPEAKQFCLEHLTDTRHTDVYVGCLRYLAAVGAKDALPLMERNLAQFGDETSRAMGILGDADAVPALERYLDRQDGATVQRVPALVALINLGKTSYYAELNETLQGLRAVRKADRDKQTAAMQASRMTLTDDRFSQHAAMESILVRNPEVSPALEAALQKLAAAGDDSKWRARTYAAIALAQRGDEPAIEQVTRDLNGPIAEIRRAILNSIGARDSDPGFYFWERGLGVLAHPKAEKAVIAYMASEGDEKLRTAALHALVNIRATERNTP